jgi:hypothetical protein
MYNINKLGYKKKAAKYFVYNTGRGDEMLKNPFGIRNDKIICVSDLSLDERGEKCNCKCVACESPLIARMGNVNIHHFAHSQKLCDEGHSYVLSMYMLVKEILDNRRKIILPSLIIKYYYSTQHITLDNIQHFIKIVSDTDEQDDIRYIKLFDKKYIDIQETYIKYRSNKVVDALIIKSHDKELALKIGLPDTVCKDYISKAYKGLSTLEIDFRIEDYDLNVLKKHEIEDIIVNQVDNKKWLSNLKISQVYPKIIEENEKYIREQEVKRKEYLEVYKVRQQGRYTSNMNTVSINPIKVNNGVEASKKPDLSQEEKYKAGYAEIIDKFHEDNFEKYSTEVIRDSYEQRWVYCTFCNKVKNADEMASYGGKGTLNQGECSECSRNNRLSSKKARDILFQKT